MAHSDHGEFREEFHGDDHPYSYDHTEPQYSLLWIIGGVIVILLVFVGIGIQFYYENTESATLYDRVLSQDSWQLRDLRNKEQWELTHYGYIDQTKGQVRIPVDQAMKLVIQESASPKYPTSAYAVKTPEQLAAAAPAVSQPGAAAAGNTQNQGITSNPNVQQSTQPQQPHK